ncbi:arylamine N-acetyltransferase [Novosphingobium sp.]|uniref:arylamine N-acetyltransferase family protein n=1 Tax=Novosphingobium sp. TaxID=1874826 RepID=UPI00262A20BC|nr:arylamine N-acetyltransferase [Novosphingobium sp.]
MTLSSGQLDSYLARIGIDRPVSLDIHGLSELHRAHLMSFTWEALDAFMGWPSSVTTAAAFTKMVVGRRGGWCYEMNGLFGAALTALGFRVTRLCGCVDRPKLGDIAIGNHLTLRVDLDRPYLAEVGVADALIEPVPIAPGAVHQRGFDFAISETPDGWMRFHNHAHGIARSMDFKADYQNEAAMVGMHDWLMRDPASPFTNALAVFRHTSDGYVSLQNDVLRKITAVGLCEERLDSADQLEDLFETVFDLVVPEPDRVWERVVAIRHQLTA